LHHVPIIGDLDDDDLLDIVFLSAEQKLVFTNFKDYAYNRDNNPVPMWRYNRRLNGTMEFIRDTVRVPEDYLTIQAAINSVSDGGTVLVSPGTYNEYAIRFHGKAITVKSTNGPQATEITYNSPTKLVMFDNGETSSSVLEGFKLEGGAVGVACYNAGPTITRNIFANQTVLGSPGSGAICLWGESTGSTGSSPAVIINNTIADGGRSGIVDKSYAPPTIKNNIIYNNDEFGIDYSPELIKPLYQPLLSYNDVYANGTNYNNITDTGTGSIMSNPWLTISYSLGHRSPCIDAGDPDSIYNDPDGSRNDMGAVPHIFLPPPPPPGLPRSEGSLPTEFSLSQNHPNPFNPITTIRFALPQAEHVRLDIYNITGQKIITLANNERAPGEYSITWNGRDSQGYKVASGIYLYRLVAGSYNETRKMILLK
jgi:hypothetical protein